MNKLKNIFFAILPFIIIAIIFFSPYNFNYLFKKQQEENKEKFVDSSGNEDGHLVDLPVKNSECSKRGKQLLDVQEFLMGKTYGCFKGKEFW